jgi:hypothetical protein
MVQTFKTVGALKEFLEHLPDDMVVVHYKSDMEKSGWFEGITPMVRPMSKETHQTWDRFDYTSYTYECYGHDSNGKEVVIL